MFTDSKSLFDVIKKCSLTAEKRLLIDIHSVRNAFDAKKISNVGFVRSENNPADPFTNLTPSPRLEQIMLQNDSYILIEQWVLHLGDASRD